jgi:hypothetical protein
VNLRGGALGLGTRGGDYEDDCGYETFPLETRGHVVDTTAHLTAEGDVLQPRLIANDGFLKEGSAWLSGPNGFIAAQPLMISGYTYGYAANVVLQPGAPVEWKFDVVDSFDRKLEGEVSFGESTIWPQVIDPTFESYDSGESWGAEDARVEGTCNPSDSPFGTKLLPPIAGARSLVIDAEGYRDRFRFTRSGNQTHLAFVAFGQVDVELTAVGAVEGPPFRKAPVVTPGDCVKYAAFCAQVPTGKLKHYSLELPPGDADVLVRLVNTDRNNWASAGGSDLCVDDLNLE